MKFNSIWKVATIMLIITSCKKSNENVTIVGKWKQKSGSYSPALMGISDYFADYSACEKDDIIEFKGNNSFEVTEGASKCDPADPQLKYDGNYSVNSDLTSLNLFGLTLKISITSNSLTLTNTFANNGITYNDVSVYQRQ